MAMKQHPKVEIRHVIDAYGGIKPMIQSLGSGNITRQAIQQWQSIPTKWVLKIESDTGFTRHQLRPDVCGSAPTSAGPKRVNGKSKAA